MKNIFHTAICVLAAIVLIPACKPDSKRSLQKKYILFEPINRFPMDTGLKLIPSGIMVFDLKSDSTFAYHLINPRTGEASMEAGFQFKNTDELKQCFANIQNYLDKPHPSILSSFETENHLQEAAIYDGSHFLLVETENGELTDWVEFIDRNKPAEIEVLTQLYRQENQAIPVNFKSYRIDDIDRLVRSFLIYPELTHYLDRKPLQSQTRYIIREDTDHNSSQTQTKIDKGN